MKQLVRNVKIIGTGSYVPETIFSNEYLETILPTTSEWIFDNVGIKERRIASKDEATSDMDKYANTSGTTIPILLDEVHRSGKIKKGNIVLFAAVGSGWTYGASIIKWV